MFSGQRLNVLQTSNIPEGPSSVIRNVKLPDLLEVAGKFVKLAGWAAFAELEFKKDKRDGVYKILEINPRMWAWIELPITCDVDFPYLYYTMATTGDCPSVSSFSEDVTLRSTLDLPRDNTFVDLGCGKGRAVIVSNAIRIYENRWNRIFGEAL